MQLNPAKSHVDMNYSFEFDRAILNINEGFGQNYCNILSKGKIFIFEL